MMSFSRRSRVQRRFEAHPVHNVAQRLIAVGQVGRGAHRCQFSVDYCVKTPRYFAYFCHPHWGTQQSMDPVSVRDP